MCCVRHGRTNGSKTTKLQAENTTVEEPGGPRGWFVPFGSPLRVGAVVKAKKTSKGGQYMRNRFYAGTIEQVYDDNTYDVKFEGFKEDQARECMAEKLIFLQGGACSVCPRPRRGQCCYPEGLPNRLWRCTECHRDFCASHAQATTHTCDRTSLEEVFDDGRLKVMFNRAPLVENADIHAYIVDYAKKHTECMWFGAHGVAECDEVIISKDQAKGILGVGPSTAEQIMGVINNRNAASTVGVGVTHSGGEG